MNNLIARKMILTSSYQPLASSRTVATVTLTAHPDNTGSAYLLGDTGDSVPLSPGEWHTLKSVNLAAIQVKGTANDVMTMIGGTW